VVGSKANLFEVYNKRFPTSELTKI